MIGIPLGWLYANAGEWLIHKHVLHGLGRKKSSFWSFHWHEHHRESRRHDMFDPQYKRSLLKWGPQSKEMAALLLAAGVHVPLFPVAPFFTGTLWFCIWRYYKVHKRAHLDPKWARQHLPWHVDHHMGRNQNQNWCVTHPFFDYVMGTRKRYLGTKEERADLGRGALRPAPEPEPVSDREAQEAPAPVNARPAVA